MEKGSDGAISIQDETKKDVFYSTILRSLSNAGRGGAGRPPDRPWSLDETLKLLRLGRIDRLEFLHDILGAVPVL